MIIETLKTFRHEYKYHIKREDLHNITDELKKILTSDRDENGYLVRSLYFDSITNTDYYDKLSGVYRRKKIRLRIYENNPKYIKLEIKKKFDNHQLKESILITPPVAIEIIKGNYTPLLLMKNDVATEIYNIMMTNCYRPKSIIEYKRMAFISNNNTRITIDFDLKKSDDIHHFFDGNINYLNLTNSNESILEVKFNQFLESYIDITLGKFVHNVDSISKYVMGRNE